MTPSPLRLLALDEEDLLVISAHLQDAVFLSRDLSYSANGKNQKNALGQFELAANRLVNDGKRWFFLKPKRSRTSLIIKRVKAIRSVGLDRDMPDEVHNVLALQFEKSGDGPEGNLILVLSGGAEVILDVESIELSLTDTSGSWEAGSRPHHPR